MLGGWSGLVVWNEFFSTAFTFPPLCKVRWRDVGRVQIVQFWTTSAETVPRHNRIVSSCRLRAATLP